MSEFLKECFARSNRPSVVQALMPGASAKYAEDIKYMTDLAKKSMSLSFFGDQIPILMMYYSCSGPTCAPD